MRPSAGLVFLVLVGGAALLAVAGPALFEPVPSATVSEPKGGVLTLRSYSPWGPVDGQATPLVPQEVAPALAAGHVLVQVESTTGAPRAYALAGGGATFAPEGVPDPGELLLIADGQNVAVSAAPPAGCLVYLIHKEGGWAEKNRAVLGPRQTLFARSEPTPTAPSSACGNVYAEIHWAPR
ncbi:MAG TPA: hypothetical protein VNZ52_03740 [Candidatus Thermoplasmatota archaeon]|nr:hypothetical protein [Candidatus Thermoplasmatota archaeon]